MESNTVPATQARAARIAGAMYFVSMVPALFAQFYVHVSLTVDDATRTARNIIEQERLFRLAIASDLVAFVTVVVLAVALYVLLRPVDEFLAKVAASCRLAEATVLCATAVTGVIALALLSGADYLETFDSGQLHSMARLSLGARGAGYNIGLLLFGLGSTVFSYLLLRSGYVPYVLAAWGIFSSLLVMGSVFWFIIFPGSARIPQLSGYVAILIYEITLGSWLVLKGARIQSSDINVFSGPTR